MSTQTFTTHLYQQNVFHMDPVTFASGKKWEPKLWCFKVEENEDRVLIGTREVTVDVPDDFDPLPAQVAALQAERAKAVAEFTALLRGIDDRLANLQCLTNEVPNEDR